MISETQNRYSRLSPCGHPAVTDTTLLRTKASPPPPAKRIKKWLKQIKLSLLRTPAITEMRTLSCPQRDISLVFSLSIADT